MLAPNSTDNHHALDETSAAISHEDMKPSPLPEPIAGSHPLPHDLRKTIIDARNKALSGGLPGMAAMVVQVVSLMWLRTTTNYQYRHGGGTMDTMRLLYRDGGGGIRGVARFYRGLGPALFQGPLSRFGDTAANGGVISFLDAHPATAGLPVAVKTAAASATAATFRLMLMPLDTYKAFKQVEGAAGGRLLLAKVRARGPGVLYHGAAAAAAASFASHYPWFAMYNYLDSVLPVPGHDVGHEDGATTTRGNGEERTPQPTFHAARLARAGFMGLAASATSDTLSNALRVVKISRQANTTEVSYTEAIREITSREGALGLASRGLRTKIIASGLQGVLFSTLWQVGKDLWRVHVDPSLDPGSRSSAGAGREAPKAA